VKLTTTATLGFIRGLWTATLPRGSNIIPFRHVLDTFYDLPDNRFSTPLKTFRSTHTIPQSWDGDTDRQSIM
jgi:hypothetical protein